MEDFSVYPEFNHILRRNLSMLIERVGTLRQHVTHALRQVNQRLLRAAG